VTVIKADFIDWLQQPVTKAVFKTLHERIRDREFELGQSAGLDPLHDRYVTGGIAAMKSFVLVDWEDIEGDADVN
jgi:hypothetical protein